MRILLKHKKRGLVFQGGSGSSKTYSILQYWIIQSLNGEWHDEVLDIVRESTPALTRSVMFDFFKILREMGLYNIDNHNRTQSTYKLGTNLFRFYSLDDENKIRGPRRDRVYFNEVLHLRKIDVTQILMRTHKQFYMDYNPSDDFSWIYEEVNLREDVTFHISTFLDNPFLDENAKKEIRRLKEFDPNLWRIYGEGMVGVAQATIYRNWHLAENTYEETEGQVLYGMDFGFNNPTVLIRIKYHKEGIYAEQLLHKSELTSDLILLELENLELEGKITRNLPIYADDARPEIIKVIKQAGFNVHAVKKEKGSVIRGIDFIKKHKVFLNKESLELIKEMRNYKWRVDKNERVLDEPVDLNDHCMDALRYACISRRAYGQLSYDTIFGKMGSKKT